MRRISRFRGKDVYGWSSDSASFFVVKAVGDVPGVVHRVDVASGAFTVVSNLDRLVDLRAQDWWLAPSPTDDRVLYQTIFRDVVWEPTGGSG